MAFGLQCLVSTLRPRAGRLLASGLKRGAHFIWLLNEVGQCVSVQNTEECRGRFIQYAFQPARWKEPARLILLVGAPDDRVPLFSQSNDLPQWNLLGRPGQREAATDAPLGIEITSAAQIVHNLDQMITRDRKGRGNLVHCDPIRLAQSGIH